MRDFFVFKELVMVALCKYSIFSQNTRKTRNGFYSFFREFRVFREKQLVAV